MKKKPASKSAFFNTRVLIGLAFCLIGLVLALVAFALYPGGNALARQNQSAPQGVAQQSVPVLEATMMHELSSAPVVSIAAAEEPIEIDLAALDIHPVAAPMALPFSVDTLLSPDGSTVGVGNASVSMSPEVANQSITSAYGLVGANFIPAESVQLFLNGSLATTAPANANGRLLFTISTGAGFGFLTVVEKGVTSSRQAGAVVQVAPTGPYLAGFAAAPHAVNNTGTPGTFNFIASRLTPATLYTIRRNGVSIGTASTTATGTTLSFTIGVAVGTNTSAVWSVDSGVAGSMAGATIEERADAGTPPAGDQNVARH